MSRLANQLTQLLRGEEGTAAIEYAATASFIVIACLLSIQTLRDNARSAVEQAAALVAGTPQASRTTVLAQGNQGQSSLPCQVAAQAVSQVSSKVPTSNLNQTSGISLTSGLNLTSSIPLPSTDSGDSGRN
jgi:Flp pilus assembly pilin Flp